MPLYFITGNTNKFREASALIPVLQQLDIDLPEIQSLDPKEIIRTKLEAATESQNGEFILEDVSFHMDALGGLPGPLIKWFLKTIGVTGLAEIAEKFNNQKAEAAVIYGYVDKEKKFHFFEGRIKGTVVAPRGESDFGFDRIFVPDGYDKTFAEMGMEAKNKISMRRIALDRLKAHLNK